MKHLLSFLLFFFVVSCDSATPKTTPQKTSKFHSDFRKGVSLGLFVSEKANPEYELKIYKKMLREIRSTGATHLSIPVRWVQQDIHASEISPRPETTVSDEVLVAVIKDAQALGLSVFLMPFVHLKERSDGKWRGTIRPQNRRLWWSQYRNFIYHYADLAAEQKVFSFSIGSELSSMGDPERWEEIIVELRKRMPNAELTYSANWDRFETFSQWGNLDLIGISTYPPLSKSERPNLAELNAGWGSFKFRLRDLRRRFPKKKVLFTEVGYTATINAARTPWAHPKLGQKADEDFQEQLYTSLLETWSKETYLEGMFVWNWFGVGGPTDNGFTPRGKKAEKLLREWY